MTVIWTGERNRQQGRLVAEMYRAAAGVPCERSAAIAGGLPGADKAAALEAAGVDRSQYLTVSIDALLDRMAASHLIPEADGLSPLERAGPVHAEAQYLAKRVLLRALMDGRNLILDVSLASWRAAEAWTYALRFADYAVTAVFADISIDEAVRRSGEARRRGEEAYRRGHGHGGRHIPAAAIRALASPAAAAPRNRIRWAVGARSAGAIGGTVGTGTFPGSAVTAMLVSYRDGLLAWTIFPWSSAPAAGRRSQMSARRNSSRPGTPSTTPSPTSQARSTTLYSATTSAGCPTPTTTSWRPRPKVCPAPEQGLQADAKRGSGVPLTGRGTPLL